MIKYHQRLLSEHNKKLSESFVMKKDGEKRSMEFIKRQIRSKNANILIAKDDEKIIGYTNPMIKKYIPLFEIGWIGEIIALYVDEGYIGKHVSSLLLRKSKEWFKQKDINLVMLNVFPDNHAKEIYNHWGFSCFLQGLRVII